MKKKITGLLIIFTFLVTYGYGQDTILVKKADEITLDKVINDNVQPITDFVSYFIFASWTLSNDITHSEYRLVEVEEKIDGKMVTKKKLKPFSTKESPYVVTADWESEVGNAKEYDIKYLTPEAYELSYKYMTDNGDEYKIVNNYNFSKKVSIDGFSFNVSSPQNPTGSVYSFKNSPTKLPFVVVYLIAAALFFTFYFKFINIRGFKMAIDTVRGKYDEIDHHEMPEKAMLNIVDGDEVDTIKIEGQEGEVSHFQALTAALSGTVGLGNIAGVAIAISIGGPGATFWMILAGLIGMSSKFVECTLGVKYRDVGADGTVYGGPMYYLSKGLKERGLEKLGKVFAVFFAIMCVGGSFGGGNMFQANQAAVQFNNMLGIESGAGGFVFGVILAIMVAIVIIGGIKRIGNVTEKVVPFMCGIYVLAALIIIFANIGGIPKAFGLIFSGAFTATGITGGFIGVLVVGFQRAAFSNEAGIGSAAIAHSAVKTKYPASEGIVALLEPFIDTVVVCTMTALVIIITGNYANTGGVSGVDLTSTAFASVIPWFPYVLTMAVVLFAFSTMLSWSYYGLQAWMFLFGRNKIADITYKVLFCVFVVIGAAASLGAVVGFSDAMIFAMCIPNIIGLIILLPVVKEELAKYVKATESVVKETEKETV